MYEGKQVIGIIPARGGSKGIPRKNIVDLGGFPLIAWTILRAKASKYIDRLILSSDDHNIIRVAKKYGCEVPFKRPDELATDSASSVDVTLHALDELNFKDKDHYFILLQPTSPFRTVSTIDNAIRFTIGNDYPYVMSVSYLGKSPYHIYLEGESHLLEPLYKGKTTGTRRQDLPRALVSNGVIYVSRSSFFSKVKSFRPDKIHFYKTPIHESIDIDTFDDLKKAQANISNKNIIP